MKGFERTLILHYDQAASVDVPVLVVGEKRASGRLDIVKIFTGPEAQQMYQYLVSKDGIKPTAKTPNELRIAAGLPPITEEIKENLRRTYE